MNFALPVYSLAHRELVRFFRQRHRVIGAFAQPLMFWILFGAGFGRSLQLPGATQMSYLEYFFPGTLLMILLFTAIFATISIIEDRREGFLQSVLVAPLPRLSMVLGKVIGGTLIAVLQATLFLLAGFALGMPLTVLSFATVVGLILLIGVSLTCMGFILAWRMNSSQGFHAIMTVLLMPMWLLSGALFPLSGVPGWLHAVMVVNPLTYQLALLRHILYGVDVLPGIPSFALSLLVTVVFTVAAVLLAAFVARTTTRGDLQ